jgi:hypothetical protein
MARPSGSGLVRRSPDSSCRGRCEVHVAGQLSGGDVRRVSGDICLSAVCVCSWQPSRHGVRLGARCRRTSRGVPTSCRRTRSGVRELALDVTAAGTADPASWFEGAQANRATASRSHDSAARAAAQFKQEQRADRRGSSGCITPEAVTVGRMLRRSPGAMCDAATMATTERGGSGHGGTLQSPRTGSQ